MSLCRNAVAKLAQFLYSILLVTDANIVKNSYNDRSVFIKFYRWLFLCYMKEQERNIALLNYIASKCKELRAKRGVSQEAVYEDTRINIGKVETAKKNITVSTLSKLCRYYNISLIDFLQDFECVKEE